MFKTKMAAIAAQGGLLLPGWTSGYQFTIPANSIDADLPYFPCPVYLNSSNFDFSKCKADGSDIRFTDKNLNFLKHERVEHGLVNFCTTGTASASSIYSARYATSCAFDGDLTTSWLCANGQVVGSYLRYDLGAGITKRAQKASLTLDAINGFTMPSVKIQGSNNGTTWVDVATCALNYVNTPQEFTFENTAYYRYYQIVPNAASNGTYYGFIEVKLYDLAVSFAKYNVLLPAVSDLTDTEFYMWYGNPNAYNTSIEAWQDMTGKQLTYNGNVKLAPNVAKFGKAGYFDGSGDYIEVPNSSDWDLGSGDFTIRFTAQPTGTGGYELILSNSTTSQYRGFYIYACVNYFSMGLMNYDTATIKTAVIPLDGLGKRHDVAYVRKGNQLYGFLNGRLIVNIDVTGFIVTPTTNPLKIGYQVGAPASYAYKGYLDEFEFALGVARYTAGYIPEQTPYTADQYTKLLLHFDTAPFTDETGKTVTTYGDVKPIKTAYADGARSAYFDGSGDWFELSNTTNFGLGSSNFRVNLRFALWNLTATTECLYGRANSSGVITGADFEIQKTTANKISVILYSGSTAYTITSNTAFTDKSLHYMEFSRTGNTLYLFIDGNPEGTVAFSSTANTGSNKPTIGRWGEYTTGLAFTGYISEFEILVGSYGHTSVYTAPTTAPSVTADTKFLCLFDTIYSQDYAMVQHMGDSLVDATGNGNNGTATGTTVVSTVYGKARLLNGTSDHISFPKVSGTLHSFVLAMKLKAAMLNQTGILCDFPVDDGSKTKLCIRGWADGHIEWTWGTGTVGNYSGQPTPANFLINGVFASIGGVLNVNKAKFFKDGAISVDGTEQTYSATTTANGVLYAGYFGIAGYNRANAEYGELRYCNMVLPDARIKAESKALKNELVIMKSV